MRIISLILLSLVVLTGSGLRAESIKPNIVFILADDLGARDLGCFGSTFYETPNIDRLSKRGRRFTQAYAASPLCSPTRSSILVGQYPARTGITAPVCHLPQIQLEKKLEPAGPNSRVSVASSLTRLSPSYYTLAEAFKDSGYATAHFGKWHLGHNLAKNPDDRYEPKDQGFDFDFPHAPSAAGPGKGYLAPWSFIKDPDITDEEGKHIEDRMSEEAAKYIRNHREQPFFVNYWAYSVHSPWNARQDYIEHFQNKADPRNPQHNALYAAMVKSLDDGVGRILDAIDEAGISERTIIVFYSDNGGYAYPPKKTAPDGYADIPATSNLPFRSGKASLYEGGTREPFLLVWPGKVKADTQSDILFQSTDFYPTLLSMCGLAPKRGIKLDGYDQSKAFLGEPSPRDRLFCHFPHGGPGSHENMPGFYPGTYVRKGDWKLIRFYGMNADGSDKLELYNLKTDMEEASDTALQHPQIVEEMNNLITAFLKDTEAVVPKYNEKYGTTVGAPKDPLMGWKNRNCDAMHKEGVLIAKGTAAAPFLGIGAGLNGAAKVSFRMRCSVSGKGRIDLISEGAKATAPPVSAPYEYVANDSTQDWQTITVSLPPSGPIAILRLYLPSETQAVEFQEITITPETGTPRRWKF